MGDHALRRGAEGDLAEAAGQDAVRRHLLRRVLEQSRLRGQCAVLPLPFRAKGIERARDPAEYLCPRLIPRHADQVQHNLDRQPAGEVADPVEVLPCDHLVHQFLGALLDVAGGPPDELGLERVVENLPNSGVLRGVHAQHRLAPDLPVHQIVERDPLCGAKSLPVPEGGPDPVVAEQAVQVVLREIHDGA